MDSRFICTVGAIGAVVMVSLMLLRIPEKEDSLQLREPVGDIEIEESVSQQSQEEELKEEDYAYLLKEYDGRIGVFKAGNEEGDPEMILNVSVRFLPDYDQVLMQQGVPARDYSHLESLIEDYIS